MSACGSAPLTTFRYASSSPFRRGTIPVTPGSAKGRVRRASAFDRDTAQRRTTAEDDDDEDFAFGCGGFGRIPRRGSGGSDADRSPQPGFQLDHSCPSGVWLRGASRLLRRMPFEPWTSRRHSPCTDRRAGRLPPGDEPYPRLLPAYLLITQGRLLSEPAIRLNRRVLQCTPRYCFKMPRTRISIVARTSSWTGREL